MKKVEEKDGKLVSVEKSVFSLNPESQLIEKFESPLSRPEVSDPSLDDGNSWAIVGEDDKHKHSPKKTLT